ncbi:MAG: ester cyclase, partial [Limisphaerales bacterium]
VLVLAGLVFVTLAGCSGNNAELQAQLKQFTDERAMVETHLVRFDSLDFDVFSGQKWDLLNVSHTDDIVVNWPDGHHTNGIAVHIEDLKAMFVYAPDTKIETHPIRFGSGEWTCATGVMTGTFSKPMPIGGGKSIPPTGKKFSVPMCTVARWKDGKMVEESLYWDNLTFMRQIGLAK